MRDNRNYHTLEGVGIKPIRHGPLPQLSSRRASYAERHGAGEPISSAHGGGHREQRHRETHGQETTDAMDPNPAPIASSKSATVSSTDTSTTTSTDGANKPQQPDLPRFVRSPTRTGVPGQLLMLDVDSQPLFVGDGASSPVLALIVTSATTRPLHPPRRSALGTTEVDFSNGVRPLPRRVICTLSPSCSPMNTANEALPPKERSDGSGLTNGVQTESKHPSSGSVDAENASVILTTSTGERATVSHAWPSEQERQTVVRATIPAARRRAFSRRPMLLNGTSPWPHLLSR